MDASSASDVGSMVRYSSPVAGFTRCIRRCFNHAFQLSSYSASRSACVHGRILVLWQESSKALTDRLVQTLPRDSVVAQSASNAEALDHAFHLLDRAPSGGLLRAVAATVHRTGAPGGRSAIAAAGRLKRITAGQAQRIRQPVMNAKRRGERMGQRVRGAEILLERDGSHGRRDLHISARFDIACHRA